MHSYCKQNWKHMYDLYVYRWVFNWQLNSQQMSGSKEQYESTWILNDKIDQGSTFTITIVLVSSKHHVIQYKSTLQWAQC